MPVMQRGSDEIGRPSPRNVTVLLAGMALVAGAVAATETGAELPLEQLEVPDGFRIELYATGVPDARQMALSDSGVLYVGSRRAGQVHAVIDRDGDHRADEVARIADELDMPSGLAYRDGSLYVAALDRVLRYDGIDEKLQDPPQPVVVTSELPDDRHHGWKYLGFGPDGKLYVPVGVNCNICDPEDPYATILRMNADGTGSQIWVRGVRNTVGFDWRPGTDELWFADNGRDMMGDDVPPDELNRVTEKGQHFGFPYCHGGDIPDPQYGKERSCDEFRAPAQNLGPHVAAIGMKFYRGDQFPAEYRGSALIAEHGSWNRRQKIGYRITAVDVDAEGNASNYRPLVSGWLQGQKNWGRPTDVLEMPDGSLLIADDQANAIYRLSYSGGDGGAASSAP
ncbi:MAG: sorbosone dehydrogenase family protein [Acidobacteria bacterium]|nr:MAG: sorbosone dehydrogenase family protein [Acidobacteriota bacterium]REK01131.1 MAG: sorbosone dehydrogenase family protein [Acidobacteriota bacterium]